jgi:TolB-like protein
MEQLTAPAGDEELAELARALGDETCSALARFLHLKVAFEDQHNPQLHARYVLKGTLRRGGRKLRLTVQLRNRPKGNQVWGGTFDRVADDVLDLDLQDDLV